MQLILLGHHIDDLDWDETTVLHKLPKIPQIKKYYSHLKKYYSTTLNHLLPVIPFSNPWKH